MASLDWRCRRVDEVTLVELAVRSEFDQGVRIESQLTPVWPPRRQGVPAAGWEGATFEGVVEAGTPLVLGYASPAEPVEPPAILTQTGAPTDEAVTARDVVRALGDVTPPRDATAPLPPQNGSGHTTPDQINSTHLPVDQVDPTHTASDRENTTHTASDRKNSTHTPTDGTGSDQTAPDQSEVLHHPPSPDTRSRGVPDAKSVSTETDSDPGDADSGEALRWFEAVEGRLASVERLSSASDADEARAVLEELGGIESARSLQATLESDRRQLQEVRGRAEQLHVELSTAEVPLATLERIV